MDKKSNSFSDSICEMENKEYTQHIFFYIVCILKMFSDAYHRLTSGLICKLLLGVFPEYGATPAKKKKLNEMIKAVENDPALSDDQKDEESLRLRKEFDNRRTDSLRRTVSNNLKHYFNYSTQIEQIMDDTDNRGEEYDEGIETLLFSENIMKMMMAGVIRKEYDKGKRCDLYWFESLLDPSDIEQLENTLDENGNLLNGEKEYIKNAVIMTMTPSVGALREADKSDLPYSGGDFESAKELDIEDAKSYATLWDECAELKQHLAKDGDDAA